MRDYLLLIIVLLISVNCAKKYKPGIKKIDVYYLSFLYQDIFQEKPALAGLKNLDGLKIGIMNSKPPFLEILMAKLGFYNLLNETGIDFVIGDPETFHTENINYFFIPHSMGYAIKNFQGIRFAILSADKDSLTIADNVTLTLVKERSDLLWFINKAFLKQPAQKITFFIKDRGLSDTTVSNFPCTPDTVLLKKIKLFGNRLSRVLNQTLDVGDMTFNDFILTRLGEHNMVNVILYPANLFEKNIKKQKLTIFELLNTVNCTTKFQKRVKLTREIIEDLQQRNNFARWGEIRQSNDVLVPDQTGAYLFDLLDLAVLSNP